MSVDAECVILCVFFFQAEDGIRDLTVTGVQTCALPLAPVRTPETIAWVAMGFVADEALAQKIRDLVGSQVAIVTHGSDGVRVAATLPSGGRAATGSPAGAVPAPSDLPHLTPPRGTDH